MSSVEAVAILSTSLALVMKMFLIGFSFSHAKKQIRILIYFVLAFRLNIIMHYPPEANYFLPEDFSRPSSKR